MPANDPITALDYNNIFNQVNPILGTSNTGYGRTMVSSQVVGGSTPGVSDKVSEEKMTQLFLDLQAGYVHQNAAISPSISLADFAADTTIEFNDVGDAANDIGLKAIANDVDNFIHTSGAFPAGNFDEAIVGAAESVRNGSTNPWGGAGLDQTISHEVFVTFASNTARDHYFNAGGEIRFIAQATGGTTSSVGTKDYNWAQMLQTLVTVRFDKFTTFASSGTSVLGYQGLNTSYQLCFSKAGAGSIYNDNEYRVFAKLATNRVDFRIDFFDGDTGTGAGFPDPRDENVTAEITSAPLTFTPNSEFTIGVTTYPAIQLSTPTVTKNSDL